MKRMDAIKSFGRAFLGKVAIEEADLNAEASNFSNWYLKNAIPHLKGAEMHNAANYMGHAFINGVKFAERRLGIRK